MLLLEFLPRSLSCKPQQSPTPGLDLSRVAALEQGVTSHAKPQPDNFVFAWVLLWPCALGIGAVTGDETLWRF